LDVFQFDLTDLVIMYTCMSRPAKQTSLFLSVLNALIWWYTNQYLPVSKSLSWYWQYQSVRSNWKTSKLLIIKIIYPFTTTNEIAKQLNDFDTGKYWLVYHHIKAFNTDKNNDVCFAGLDIHVYIITSITARPVTLSVILAIMFVSTFKLAVILNT
jgi:hypothetical protein